MFYSCVINIFAPSLVIILRKEVNRANYLAKYFKCKTDEWPYISFV